MDKSLKRWWWKLIFLSVLVVAIVVRFWQVMQFPPALYWEEVALGYDAFSILETGKDHHGHSFPIVAFESFGDYKPSLYFYAVVPFIKVFGLTALAVRLPSMIAGVLIVVGTGLFAREVFAKWSEKHFESWTPGSFQLLVMGVAAVSPWAILFSRAAWEVNLATALITWGMYLGMRSQRKLLALILLALSMYAYHAARMIAPLLGMSLFWYWAWEAGVFQLKEKFTLHQKSIAPFVKKVLPVGVVFVVLISPLLFSLSRTTTQQRFAETNIFADGDLVAQSNYYRELSGNSIISRVLYHRYVFYAREMFQNFFAHFSLDFLFLSGDSNLRHSVQYMGQLYHVEFFLVLLGLFVMVRYWRKEYAVLVWWLVVSILPASLTKAAPHALRTLPTLPVFMILIGLGLVELQALSSTVLHTVSRQKVFSILKKLLPYKYVLFLALVVGVYAIEFTVFWRFYSLIYPRLYAQEWQFGYQEMVTEVHRRQAVHPASPVFITREYGRPAMYYWFFTKTDPRAVQAAQSVAQKDQGEFVEFQNIQFPRSVNEVEAGIVASSPAGVKQLQAAGKKIVDPVEIRDPNAQVVWVVYQLL